MTSSQILGLRGEMPLGMLSGVAITVMRELFAALLLLLLARLLPAIASFPGVRGERPQGGFAKNKASGAI